TLDKVGNVRVDRIVAAVRLDDKGKAQRFVVRITGACDVKAAFKALTAEKGVKVEQRKGPSGEAIEVGLADEAAFAFVGEADLLILVDHTARKPLELLDEVLAVKAGKAKSLADGPLGKLLEQAPGAARMLLAGD